MLKADLILHNLAATSKKQALRAIAQETAMLFHGRADDLLNVLLDRERIGTTGIGCGVAIPHVKVEGVDRVYGVLARLEEPVDYDAVDGAPVDIIFMLLAPADSKTTQHLKTLALMSRFLRDGNTCAQLRAAAETADIETLLIEWATAQAA